MILFFMYFSYLLLVALAIKSDDDAFVSFSYFSVKLYKIHVSHSRFSLCVCVSGFVKALRQ